MLTALNYAYQRGDLALCQGVVIAPAGGVDQVFQAVTAAIYFAAGDLDRSKVLDDANDGVEVVAWRRLHAAYVLPLLEVLPPVTKDRHAQIVHWLEAAGRFVLSDSGYDKASRTTCFMIVCAGEQYAGGETEADVNAKRVLEGVWCWSGRGVAARRMRTCEHTP